MTTRILSAAVLAITLSLAGSAAADAVPPEPTDCEDGSLGATCHGGPFCRPNTCDSRDDCEVGEVCVEEQVCISSIDCGGIGGPAPTDAFEGYCADGNCATGTCETTKLCVPEGGATAVSSGATTSSGTTGAGASTSVSGGSAGEGGSGDGTKRVDQGCGCEVVGADSSRPWWLLLGALTLLPLRRHRRRH